MKGEDEAWPGDGETWRGRGEAKRGEGEANRGEREMRRRRTNISEAGVVRRGSREMCFLTQNSVQCVGVDV